MHASHAGMLSVGAEGDDAGPWCVTAPATAAAHHHAPILVEALQARVLAAPIAQQQRVHLAGLGAALCGRRGGSRRDLGEPDIIFAWQIFAHHSVIADGMPTHTVDFALAARARVRRAGRRTAGSTPLGAVCPSGGRGQRRVHCHRLSDAPTAASWHAEPTPRSASDCPTCSQWARNCCCPSCSTGRTST